MPNINIPEPTPEIVQSRLNEWGGLDKYVLQEECLNLLFQELLPGNREVRDILIKVSALNDFYSTNIYDTHTVARHIASLNIEGFRGQYNTYFSIDAGDQGARSLELAEVSNDLTP